MSATTCRVTRELDYRESDGLKIRLNWNELASPPVWVHVLDERLRNSFCVDVDPGDRALDVFHHPFAYRARRQRQLREQREGVRS